MSGIALHETTVLVFAGLLLTAAVWDALCYRIPNLLGIALLALYPLHVAGGEIDWHWALPTAGIVFLLGTVAFLQGWMGGGDVKLLTVTALWSGPALLPATFFVISISGGLLALVMLTPVRHRLSLAHHRAGRDEARDLSRAAHLPYGIAIATGGLFLAWRLLGAPV